LAERRVRWTAETVLLGSGVFGNIAMSTLSPALPKIEASFASVPDADYLTKLLVSATGLGVIVASPFTGMLVRKFGRRGVTLGAYAMFLFFGMVGMILPSLPMIIASRFFAGGAGAIIVAMGLILIGDFYEGRPRERRIGASHAIGAFLLAMIMPVAGFLADINWRLSFLVHLAALPMLLFVFASPELSKPPLASAAQVKADLAKGRIPFSVFVILLLTLMAGGIGYSVQIFVPFHLKGIGANSAGLAGTMLAISVIASMVTSFLYAELRRWLSVSLVFALAMFGWFLGLGTTAMTTTVTGTFVGMAIIGLGGGLIGPNIFTAVSALTTDSVRTHAVGIIKGIYYFGPFFGPTMLQLLSLHAEPETALLSLSIFAGGLGILCLIVGIAIRATRTGPTDPAATEEALDAAFEAELKADRA
jgi:MFS family permease